MRHVGLALLPCLLAATPAALAEAVQVDPGVPAYTKASGVSGNLNAIGSDTLNNLMTLWAEGFKKHYPNVRIQIEGKGSSTAPPALISGTAQLGPMSREMKSTEIDEFEKKFGYKPTQVRVAIDALAVYVQQGQPAREADAAAGRRDLLQDPHAAAYPTSIDTWGALGLQRSRAPRSRSASTAATRPPAPTASSRSTRCARATSRTRSRSSPARRRSSRASPRTATASATAASATRPRASSRWCSPTKDGEPYHGVDAEKVLAGKYPLSRFLYVYVNKTPNKPLDPLVREFLPTCCRREGQEIVVKDGYLPLPADRVAQERTRTQ